MECVIIPSRRLYISLVWKSASTLLREFLKCAFGWNVTISQNTKAACLQAPPSYRHLAIVRDPFERFLSGYLEFLSRAKSGCSCRGTGVPRPSVWNQAENRSSAERDRDLLKFARTSRCQHAAAWAHVASQSWFLRTRPVDTLLHVSGRLGEDLVEEFGSPQCLTASNVSREPSALGVDEATYHKLLREHEPLRRGLCERYVQDIVCLRPRYLTNWSTWCLDLVLNTWATSTSSWGAAAAGAGAVGAWAIRL